MSAPLPPDPRATPPGAELLAHLVREARQELPPPVDEARLERELFRRLDAEPLPPPARPAHWPLRLVVAGVAAAAAFAVASKRDPAPAPVAVAPAPPPPAPPPAAPRGDEAGDEPLAFSRPGLASWTLEPHARASLVEDGERVVLALERGALRVDVVPAQRPGAERFAVLVDGARVSVRGTHFRVARSGERFDVDVTQGVVAVTPPNAAPADGWLLRAPRGGTFRVDGAEGALRDVTPFDAPPAAAATAAAPAGTAVAGRHAPPAPAAPPKLPDLEVARADWSRLVSQCFLQEARSNPQVNVMVTTTLRIEFRPDGRTQSVAFDPPLAPAVESCARQKLGGELGPAGAHDLALSLSGR
ncbi:MAG TPA: FecR domain-containing protein [Polyangiaceae bacterium]|nr:FecR domain-containing protein [Polyangiaceae bacterium]